MSSPEWLSSVYHEFGHFIEGNTAASIATNGQYLYSRAKKKGREAKVKSKVNGLSGEGGLVIPGMFEYQTKFYGPQGRRQWGARIQCPKTSGGCFFSTEFMSIALQKGVHYDKYIISDPRYEREQLDLITAILKERQGRTRREREEAAMQQAADETA